MHLLTFTINSYQAVFFTRKCCIVLKWIRWISLQLEERASSWIWILHDWSHRSIINVWLMPFWASHWGAVVWVRYGQRSHWSSYRFSNTRKWLYWVHHIIYTGWIVLVEIPCISLLVATCWGLGIPCMYGIRLESCVVPTKQLNFLCINWLLQLHGILMILPDIKAM
jgi:hypothetical protein